MKKIIFILACAVTAFILAGCSTPGVSTYGKDPAPHKTIADRYFIKVYFGIIAMAEADSRPVFEAEANKWLRTHPEYKGWYLVPAEKDLDQFFKENPQFSGTRIIPATHRKNPRDTAFPSAWHYEVQFMRF